MHELRMLTASSPRPCPRALVLTASSPRPCPRALVLVQRTLFKLSTLTTYTGCVRQTLSTYDSLSAYPVGSESLRKQIAALLY